MKRLVSLKDNSADDSMFVIKWRITRMCNIRCSYCIQSGIRQEFTWERLRTETDTLMSAANDISALMDRLPEGTMVKLELVGGEVSLFDIEGLLSAVTSPRLVLVHITTNFMRGADYYGSLASYLRGRGIGLMMACSFHSEFIDIDEYFDKVLSVRGNCSVLVCELVSNGDNQELCATFRERCEAIGVDYMIEKDLRNEEMTLRRDGTLACWSRRKSQKPRYSAVFDDDGKRIEQEYMTRNELLTDTSIDGNTNYRSVRTRGYICTQSWDYVYVDVDKAVGRTTESNDCTNRMPIADFVPVKPCECPNAKCTLCGHVSLLYKN